MLKTMIRKLLLLGITCFTLTSVTLSNSIHRLPAFDFSDTSVLALRLNTITGSSVSSIASGKSSDGFSDLYIATSLSRKSGAKLNPRAIRFVKDYVEKNSLDLQEIKSNGLSYFSLIDGIMNRYGLPRELKYLAVIESELKSNSVSWAGAVGPWQLMPQTARDLGLKVNHKYDERTNFAKSTKAAALYLRDLYGEYGDWLLVIAAYNTGTANVDKAIRKSGSRNFWDLQNYLPAESRNHVKKFIATQYVFEGQGSVTTLTRQEANEQLTGSSMFVFARHLNKAELQHSESTSISGKYHSSIIAKYVLMDQVEFDRYNPDFDKIMACKNNTYELKLPAEKMELFVANKYQILDESSQLLLKELNENDLAKDDHSIASKDR
jgi:membrane-bound lytic murein transglycosylase D